MASDGSLIGSSLSAASTGAGGGAASLSSEDAFTLTEANQHLDFWRDFDLDGRRLALDKTCVDMKEMKASSINARKRLNEVTKSFRSKNKEEQTLMISEVLRDYQEEIDSLSKRAKFSEAAFYSLYKALYEAPDPVFTIEQLLAMISSSSTHQLEIERLRSELSQYDEEFQQLKNQDITIRRLEEQLQEFRDKIEDKVNEEVKLRAVEAEQAADQRISEMKEVQRSAERRLAAALESMRQSQNSADRAQSQLFEFSSRAEMQISGLQAENAILAEGSQRANSRIAELERQLEQMNNGALAMKNSSLGSTLGTTPASATFAAFTTGFETEGAAVDNGDKALHQILLADLRAECQRKDEAMRAERQRFESTAREMTAQLSSDREAMAKLQQELSSRPSKEDYTDMKRQLRVLQRAMFNIEDDDLGGLNKDHPEDTAFAADKIQIEILLTNKIKALETELAECRRNLSESREQERMAKSAVTSLKTSLESNAALIRRLEADLEMRTNKTKMPTLSPTSAGDLSQELVELLDTQSLSLHSTSAGGNGSHLLTLQQQQHQQQLQQQQLQHGLGKSSTIQTPSGADGQQQLVGILQAQRDRYKERLTQVESTLLQTQQQLDAVSAAKGQLEVDNLSLYSKIRFLQTYGNASSAGFGGNGIGRPAKSMKIRGENLSLSSSTVTADEELGFGTADQQRDVERRYQSLYEQRMSPFAEFSQFERQRKLNELSVADRIVLNTTMAFVSSHAGRSFLLIYLGAMHLLVFVTLYYSAHHVHYGCDPAIDHLLLQHQQDLAASSAAVATSIAAAAIKSARL